MKLTKKQQFKLFKEVVTRQIDKFGLKMWRVDFISDEMLEAEAAFQYYADGNRRCAFIFNPSLELDRKQIIFAALHEFGHFLVVEFTALLSQIREGGAHLTDLEILKVEEAFANIVANAMVKEIK